jgi:hypothetical protein
MKRAELEERITEMVEDTLYENGVDIGEFRHTRDATVAIIEMVLEYAAQIAMSDKLILGEHRSRGSFGGARKNHGELIALMLRQPEEFEKLP